MRWTFYKRVAQCAAPIAAAVLIGTAAPAGAQDQEDTATAEEDINASNRIVCRRMPPPLGSRLGSRRICKTELEWAQLETDSETTIREVQNRIPLNSN